MIDIRQYEFFNVERGLCIAIVDWHTFIACHKFSGHYDQKCEVWETNRTINPISPHLKGIINPHPTIHNCLILLSEKSDEPSYLYTKLIQSGELSNLDWDWIRTNFHFYSELTSWSPNVYKEQLEKAKISIGRYQRDKKINTLLT